MKVAVLGGNGQLGTDVVLAFRGAGGQDVLPMTHAQVEVTDPESVRAALAQGRADVVVNCAAFHRVDDCEKRPDEAFRVNALGALHVARACAEINALCVYISTDYVFDGQKGMPYTEEDCPRPVNTYGASKLAGEHLVAQSCPRWIIARVASLFGRAGPRGKRSNFVEAILSKGTAGEPVRVVDDMRMSPTYTHDAARALAHLIRQGATGVFHLTNAGACSWFEYAEEILALAHLEATVEPVRSSDHFSAARRPRNSSLRGLKVDGPAKQSLRPWEEALKAYLDDRNAAARREP